MGLAKRVIGRRRMCMQCGRLQFENHAPKAALSEGSVKLQPLRTGCPLVSGSQRQQHWGGFFPGLACLQTLNRVLDWRGLGSRMYTCPVGELGSWSRL